MGAGHYGALHATIGFHAAGTIGTLITATQSAVVLSVSDPAIQERKIKAAALQLISPCRAS
jgi:hypothetical protein